MILRRLLEFLPLALLLGTTMAALRHTRLRDILARSLSYTGRIVLWLAVGAAGLHLLLALFVRD